MTEYNAIKIFDQKRIRTLWDEEKETWYYSIVDVVSVLTDQPDARHAAKYWSVLKTRLSKEGCELTTNCRQLKMPAEDGKMRLTDVADSEQLLRIIQSIPSPKAEPFKLWLAQVGRERLDEIDDPELAISRALLTYRRKGYSENWINQRLKSIEFRKALTDEWERCGVKEGIEYASLTDIISKEWSGMTTREYKKPERFEKGKPAGQHDQYGIGAEHAGGSDYHRNFPFQESARLQGKCERRTGRRRIVGNTRREIEEKTGRSVISSRGMLNNASDNSETEKK